MSDDTGVPSLTQPSSTTTRRTPHWLRESRERLKTGWQACSCWLTNAHKHRHTCSHLIPSSMPYMVFRAIPCRCRPLRGVARRSQYFTNTAKQPLFISCYGAILDSTETQPALPSFQELNESGSVFLLHESEPMEVWGCRMYIVLFFLNP